MRMHEEFGRCQCGCPYVEKRTKYLIAKHHENGSHIQQDMLDVAVVDTVDSFVCVDCKRTRFYISKQ